MTSFSSNNFANKVIAVTGAASGIGRAVTVYLASRGASLAISDIQADALLRLTEELSALNPDVVIKATVVDVSKSDQVRDWIQGTAQEFGRIDGAANIAGIGGSSQTRLEEETDAEWQGVLDINLSGTMYCMREELRHIVDGGSIVNTSSVLGLRSSPSPGGSAYVASKHAVLGLTRNAAREYGARNIRVNCINPFVFHFPQL
ncbi:3-oxoacyl-(acyl-carrier-protein) reductase [Colletotrichum karsti]|uniref:3-oxoacyl-(Acyl-carrier-protein) reductase n=1 Tax=Colletotrichum karsti TaxID=1095194 RepID=A0A9P6HS43_9PEZI|nr:3-oxoacyl-(acyl-carrier-protein) reductase [Colletotrichum karsti]KAF9869268.1 3-oxoacyl-(acyl-carrier-protein) reductase [Colletotrichum karsti]